MTAMSPIKLSAPFALSQHGRGLNELPWRFQHDLRFSNHVYEKPAGNVAPMDWKHKYVTSFNGVAYCNTDVE